MRRLGDCCCTTVLAFVLGLLFAWCIPVKLAAFLVVAAVIILAVLLFVG